MTKKDHRRRYRLHQKVKNKILLFARERKIITPFDYVIKCKYIIELQQKFQYNIISEMINPNIIEVINPIIL